MLLLALDPAIEYQPAIGQQLPDMDAVVHGHDGYEAVWRHLIDSFEDFHAEPEEVLDLDDTLLGTARYAGHGSGSGVPADVRLFQVFRLRHGLVVWQRDFTDRSAALEAAAQGE